ncbi:hypothetical protein Clacol_009231 [Clathrus columnatus]|uniref:Uncharacterized protein n=1 Tax=Clathrus columnatus TaxID=1419009 RepID=A0AAV5ARH3_9AGAM|nr:hypothetical protein Clacol_009231 [Clathrus columnatus]
MRLNQDLFHVLKREKQDDSHLDHLKNPKKVDRRHRKKARRPTTSLGFADSSMGIMSPPQPFNGFLTPQPSMTGFSFFPSISNSAFPPLSRQTTFVPYPAPASTPVSFTEDEPGEMDVELDNVAFNREPSSLLLRTETNHSPRDFKRHSFPIIQPSSHIVNATRVVYTTSRASSPTLNLPPTPPMPSEDVNVQTKQRILEETIEINKQFLKKWEQESHQHMKSVLLNNILERNKFIRHLTNDIREHLNPRKSIWPETQYPLCIIITEEDDDLI